MALSSPAGSRVNLAELPEQVTVVVWGQYAVVKLSLAHDYLRWRYIVRMDWDEATPAVSVVAMLDANLVETKQALIDELRRILHDKVYPLIKRELARQAQPSWMLQSQ